MKNQIRNGAALSSHDLLTLLVEEMKRLKKEETAAKKAAEIAETSRNFSGLWAEAIASGMNAKEVVSLQNLNLKLREVGEMLGVTAGRARQIRMKAERKMRHPKRHDLAKKLGLSVRRFIDDDNAESSHPESKP